ncbi:uncharacterized protein [Rutidosis leptorrhynchoides]|uniref:uncharacterized protein n=1 Tax=Rutidosis leptorrhynchoides TaxID=125765 RepID=UPI003A997574
MRSPTATDVALLYSAHEEKHGFKGMLGSIDCMHWEWKNCPVAYKGQYTRGDHKKPTIMLDGVASYDLWIWHAFFGMAGSNNDINVLIQSPIFDALNKGTAPSAPFEVNGNEYTNTKGYYLADGIYPDWVTLIKGMSCPTDEPRIKFTRFQASARKDKERAFGVLQGLFYILSLAAQTMKIRLGMVLLFQLANSSPNGQVLEAALKPTGVDGICSPCLAPCPSPSSWLSLLFISM